MSRERLLYGQWPKEMNLNDKNPLLIVENMRQMFTKIVPHMSNGALISNDNI